MSLLEILEFPDPRLRQHARPVTVFDDALRQLCQDMLHTMYEAPGIGLAATQVNHPIQLLVLDVSENNDQPMILANPQVTPLAGEKSYDEGCLSVPGFYEPVIRPDRIRVQARNEHGEALDFECDGLLSVCIQHEADHLNGKLFVDYLSSLKRDRIRKKLEKKHRDEGRPA